MKISTVLANISATHFNLFQVVVEINKNVSSEIDSNNIDNSKVKSNDNQTLQEVNKKAEETSKKPTGTKPAKQNLDEIVTLCRDESSSGVCSRNCGRYANVPTSDDEDAYEEKGFILQRAWCCLSSRRS